MFVYVKVQLQKTMPAGPMWVDDEMAFHHDLRDVVPVCIDDVPDLIAALREYAAPNNPIVKIELIPE